MANSKSAGKRARQSERRRVVNRQNRGRLRTGVKALRAAVDSGKPEELQALLSSTVSLIDKSVQKGVIHKNTAARHKRRLTRQVNALAKA
jgi:small subunit ribosomal protein S20